MIVSSENLRFLFTAFNVKFKEGFDSAKSHALDVALEIPSSAGEEIYPFLGQWPMLREWIGDRVINSLVLHDFAIKNRMFESTVSLPREKIEDDRYGVFSPMVKQIGSTTKLHPDTIVFPMLSNGFSSKCYDGQNFFDPDHPSTDANGDEITISNMQAGAGPAWFLLDTTQAMRPFIWQVRKPYEFQTITASDNNYVFMRDEYLYGVRARVNAGYGLWQLAFASQAPLNADNFAAAKAAMMSMRGDRGGVLGVSPNLLVCGPSLEKDARTLLKATSVAEIVVVGGTETAIPATNVWHEAVDLLVTPFLP